MNNGGTSPISRYFPPVPYFPPNFPYFEIEQVQAEGEVEPPPRVATALPIHHILPQPQERR